MSSETNKRLTALLPPETETSLWHDTDLAGLLRHQLSAPLLYDLETLRGMDLRVLESLAAEAEPPVTSFRDLLEHPAPPRELLVAVKRYAKQSRNALDRPLPPQIGLMLYFATIAAAARRGLAITKLQADQQLAGVTWCLAQPWLEPRLRTRLNEAEQTLRSQAS